MQGDEKMGNLYIADSKKHCSVIIHAETEKECMDLFAEMLGYKSYLQMENELGKDVAKVDSQLMYKVN
jgi:hypothetical protein